VAVVLDPGVPAGPGRRADSLPVPLVLTATRQGRRLSMAHFPVPVEAIDRGKIPNWFSARSPKHPRDLAASVRTRPGGRDAGETGSRAGRAAKEREQADGEAEIAALRRRLRSHPCHACPDREEHSRQDERRARLEREVERLEAAVAGRSHVIARTFARVCTVLEHLGYISGGQVTEAGQRLGSLYTELDLLAAEWLRRGRRGRAGPAGPARGGAGPAGPRRPAPA